MYCRLLIILKELMCLIFTLSSVLQFCYVGFFCDFMLNFVSFADFKITEKPCLFWHLWNLHA